MSRAAVFLDRDGTIIEERGYLADPAGAVLENKAAEGLRAMAAMGYALVVVSNQSGIARGYFTSDSAEAVNRRIADLLAREGVDILAWYFCPHGPADGCRCRKPLPGMLEQAAREHDLDLPNSFVIGDKRVDVELALAAGCVGILVETGYGRENAAWALTAGYAVCRDLLDASTYVRARGS